MRRYVLLPWATVVALSVPAMLLTGCEGGGIEEAGPFGVPVWAVGDEPVRIGSVDDADYAFSAVVDLGIAPDGALYTTHSAEAAVRRWSADGLPAGTLGREGEGPGEFMSPRTLGFFGDSLWVMDFRTYRASFFSASTGGFLGSVRPRVDLGSVTDGNATPPRPDRPLRDGHWYGRTPGWSDAIARGDLTRGMHVRMDSEGMTTGTVWTQEWRPTDIWAILRDGGGSFMPQPYGDDPLYHVYDDGGMLVIDRRVHAWEGEGSFSVTRISPEGDTLLHRSVPFDPIPLPAAHGDSTLTAQAEDMHGFMERFRPGSTTLAGTREGLAETLFVPPFLPAVKKLVVSGEGEVWLERHLLDAASSEWWILDTELTRIGTAKVPAELDVRRVWGGWVWGVETDELDVSYIVGYPLTASGG